ncbi:PEPxxWA-CTERM sorting domain-containing protein [Phenylobacterium sp.]|uniref:PEPxxWA-CTERM sorting domain-containing protein n=1 Tax=Phenylobacterium sp. TaxID=1871053 RepID=UPI0025F5A5DB|nr:PEPxxWA-CTERM sorting domain-containing protein [Phenylobacterium sp.]
MNGKSWMIAAALIVVPVSAQALGRTMTNGSGDGQVSITVTGGGGAGNSAGGAGGFYNPVGPSATAYTVAQSDLYYRVGGRGPLTSLTKAFANGEYTTFTLDLTTKEVFSRFYYDGLFIQLRQQLSGIFDMGIQVGSLLTQEYGFFSQDSITLDLVRYLDVDLVFDGGTEVNDGGGMLTQVDGSAMLFGIEGDLSPDAATTSVGIYNEGGVANGYQIGNYITLNDLVTAGGALSGSIAGDGSDSDLFIDAGAGHDVALALGARLDVPADIVTRFTTYTFFRSDPLVAGQGPGGPIGGVPEPTTWAMMIIGFGLTGSVVRRRKPSNEPRMEIGLCQTLN